MVMRVDIDVAMEVACHEAMVRQAYKDSAGVWTWSVGLTSATGHKVDRYIGKPQPLQHCLDVYVWALRNYARQVEQVFAGHHLSKAQFAAAVSFHWNTGAIKRATWVKRWKAGDMPAARRAFMAWSKPPEIKARRQKERDLFFDGKWSNNGTMTEITRLDSRSRPDFTSARRINVAAEMRAAFANAAAPVMDIAARPYNRPLVPTLSLGSYPVMLAAADPAIYPDRDLPIEPVNPKPLSRSRTIYGAAAAEVSGSALVVDSTTELASAAQQAEASISAGTVFSLVIGLIIMFGAGFAIYARWDDGGRWLPGFIERRLKKKGPE